MPKVDLPKNYWISSADVGFYKDGLYSGSYGLTLHFQGNEPGSTDIIAEILQPLTKIDLPKRKLVRFEGLFPTKDPTDSIALAIRAFQSWGFKVHAIIDVPQSSLPWVPLVDWLVVRTDRRWIPIASHELWYIPPQTENDILEPELPRPENTLLYLSKGYSVAQTTKFILNAKYNWFLL